MAKLMKIYKNGNYFVEIYDDGTKIRICNDDKFKPKFPECIDLTVSKCCDNGCQYCYMGCTLDGKFGKFFNDGKLKNFFKTIHPGTELAINFNGYEIKPLELMELASFLREMADNEVIVNMTVNQRTFMKKPELFLDWQNRGWFNGLGISYVYPEDDFIEKLKCFKNVVLHLIVGLVDKNDFYFLKDKNLKILLLGYKEVGMGAEYNKNHESVISFNTEYLMESMESVFNSFEVVSFDNLAIEQLHIKERLSEDEWNRIYMGDEGQFTFYIDLVDETFAINSMSQEHFPLMDSVCDMLEFIREKYNVG